MESEETKKEDIVESKEIEKEKPKKKRRTRKAKSKRASDDTIQITMSGDTQSTKEEEKITQHEVNGELLRFKWVDGVPELVYKESLVREKVKTRYFKLRPIPWEMKGLILNKNHHINTGEGRKNLRFRQANIERMPHDPTKENIVAVDDKDLVESIASQPELFEEVYEKDLIKD